VRAHRLRGRAAHEVLTMRRSPVSPLLAVLFASLLGGCTLLVSDAVDPLESDSWLDMRLQLVAFDPHVGQVTDVWLVDAMNRVQARAIFDVLEDPNQLVVLENVVSLTDPVRRRVDFYSDLNKSLDPPVDPIRPDGPVPNLETGGIDFPDHMWRVELDDEGFAEFMHSTNFTDIVDPDDPERAIFFLRDFVLRITGVDAQDGLPAEVSVYDDSGSQEQQVAYYRLSAVEGSVLEVRIGQILDQGTEYRVEISFDSGNPVCTRASGTGPTIVVEASLASLSRCPPRETM
jgi:hypothetical protein